MDAEGDEGEARPPGRGQFDAGWVIQRQHSQQALTSLGGGQAQGHGSGLGLDQLGL